MIRLIPHLFPTPIWSIQDAARSLGIDDRGGGMVNEVKSGDVGGITNGMGLAAPTLLADVTGITFRRSPVGWYTGGFDVGPVVSVGRRPEI